MSQSKAKDPAIRSWTQSVHLPSDHGDGHDSYGSGSRGSWAYGSTDSQTVVDDPERQPLLKSKAWHYTPDGSILHCSHHSKPIASSTPTYNWNKLFHSSVLVISLLVLGSFLDGVYYEQKYSLLARRWAAEERSHTSQRATWDDERKVYERNREIWLGETRQHQVDKEKWVQKHQADKEKWAQERQADREKWAQERQAEREKWAQERQADREKWAREKAAEQRKLDAISWKPLIPANKCLRYNTREYTSTLSNVPLAFDAEKICAQKSTDLHGEQVTPTYCGGEGQCGVVAGHWIASKDEPSCQTVWAGPWDKGCQSPGTRHYHTYLENMLSSENWHEMCMTTPGIDIRGVYHHSPNKCDSWNGRFWGVWFVHDSSCQ